MKRILLALAIVALVLPATRSAEAEVDVSVDFFYNNLNTGGTWVDAGDYGYAWQPSIAVSNRNWRPYTDGYWAYTDVGWTWISNEDFGWATYHYGRWARVRDRGWIWVPGREWGPAWVSWRTGGDHVGWAPLPPRRGYSVHGEAVYEGRPITGYVDVDFDIGPLYYNFVDIRYIGGSGLRSHILPVDQNVNYISNTVNVTNITYSNSTVYNYGPDYNRLSAYSTQPIQRLKLQRATDVDLNNAVQSGAVTKVQGDTLMVAAPQQFKAAEKSAAPKEVKTKIAKDQLETGWSGISDEKTKADLQAKMKKEDRKSIPPPKLEPTNPEALKGASPGAAPAEGAPAPEKEDGRGQGRGKPAPEASAAPGAESTPASDATAPKPEPKKDKGRGQAKEPKEDKSAAPQADEGDDKAKDAGKGKDKKEDAGKPDKRANENADAAAAGKMKEPKEAQENRGAKKKESRLPDMQTSERPLMPEKKKEAAPPKNEAKANSSVDEAKARGNRKAANAPQAAPPQREQAAAPKQRQAAPPQQAPQRGRDTAAPAQKEQKEKEQKEKDKGNKKDKKDDEQPEG